MKAEIVVTLFCSVVLVGKISFGLIGLSVMPVQISDSFFTARSLVEL